MESVFREFYVWCCQFVIVSTLFLATGNWLIRRRRLAKARAAAPLANRPGLQESGHVPHGITNE